MRIALDIITVSLIVLSVLFGARKGLVKTLLGFLGVLLVFLLAYKLSVPFGNFIDSTVVNRSFRSAVSGSIADRIGVELTEGDSETQLEGFNEEIESYDGEKPLFNVIGISSADIGKAIDSAGQSVVKSIFSLVDRVSRSVSRITAFIIISLAGLLLLILLRGVCDKLIKAVGLGPLNRVLGGVIGLARGLLFALLLAFLIRLSMPALSDHLTRADVDKTVVFKYSYRLVDKSVPEAV